MCDWAIEKNPWYLNYVPDQYKTQEICEKVFQEYSRQQYAVTDRFKAKRMCEKAVEESPWCLKDVLAHFKAEKMCERAVEKDS